MGRGVYIEWRDKKEERWMLLMDDDDVLFDGFRSAFSERIYFCVRLDGRLDWTGADVSLVHR